MSVDGIVIGTEITDLDRYSDELTKIFKIKSATSNLFLKHIEITVVTNPIYVKGVFMLMKSGKVFFQKCFINQGLIGYDFQMITVDFLLCLSIASWRCRNRTVKN
jgi:hypothetical protein